MMITERQRLCSMVIVMLLYIMYVFGQDKTCVIEESLIVCETRLPQVVPDNVTKVIINDFVHGKIDNETFRHSSWRSVSFLDITVNLYKNFLLYDFNFFLLGNLKALGIHSPGLTLGVDKQILYGLPKLELLNLSSCYQLQTHDLINLLNNNIGLDTLILDQTSIFENRRLLMDNAFFVLICKTKIKKLSLSGCNLLIQGPLNFSNISFTWNNVNVSNTTIALKNLNILDLIQLTKLFANVQTLDMSYISDRFWDVNYTNGIGLGLGCNNLFYNLEYLTLNHISSRNIIINNSFVDLSKCKMRLKIFHLKSNNIHFFNRTTIWQNNTRLFELDLSFNNMEYLSPSVFGTVFTLKTFLLGHNNLYRMAPYKEFKKLFVTFENLQYLDLSYNNLDWLPYEMFVSNNDLTILHLSHNKFSSVNFKIEHLLKLQFLNLDSNRILYIDSVALDKLVKLSMKLSKSARISFYDNPLLCCCKSEEFITWLVSSVNSKLLRQYECSLDGNHVSIDTHALSRIQFLCIRSKIIIGSVISGIGIVSIASLVTSGLVYRKRQRRRKRMQYNFIEEFIDGNLHEKFLCFLSFSSEDEGHCINEIFRNLGGRLKELIMTEKEVMCIGDKNFNPGFPIVDEILRCISESCVVAFIVSNSFCESHWCQMELREAYELNKPIIFICKDDIDLTKMAPLMLTIFRNFTRAKIVVKADGQIDIIPSYEQISYSILQIAVSRYENQLHIQN